MSDLDKILPQPVRRLLTTRREYLEAFDDLVANARRELRIFDPTLEGLELNAPERNERLRKFLLASRDNRLYIALHDPEHLTRHSPRTMELLVQFSAAIAVHQTEGEAARVQDCFVLADLENFVRRPVASQTRGTYVLNEFKDGRLMRERFDEIWQSSFQAVSATRLGL